MIATLPGLRAPVRECAGREQRVSASDNPLEPRETLDQAIDEAAAKQSPGIAAALVAQEDAASRFSALRQGDQGPAVRLWSKRGLTVTASREHNREGQRQ